MGKGQSSARIGRREQRQIDMAGPRTLDEEIKNDGNRKGVEVHAVDRIAERGSNDSVDTCHALRYQGRDEGAFGRWANHLSIDHTVETRNVGILGAVIFEP